MPTRGSALLVPCFLCGLIRGIHSISKELLNVILELRSQIPVDNSEQFFKRQSKLVFLCPMVIVCSMKTKCIKRSAI